LANVSRKPEKKKKKSVAVKGVEAWTQGGGRNRGKRGGLGGGRVE